MNSTTLRGVFPEPKPAHKRNFIKENMRQIKQMQGLIQSDESKATRTDRFRNIPPKVSSQYNAGFTKSRHEINQNSLRSTSSSRSKLQKLPLSKMKQKPAKPKLEIKQLREFGEIERKQELPGCEFIENEKITHRGIQTERSDDLNKLYECGVIKYPSPSVVSQLNNAKKKAPKKYQDHGDSPNESPRKATDDSVQKMQNLSLENKPDFVKQNIVPVKQKSRQENVNNSSQIPSSYQKGVVPKYIKERKDERLKDAQEDVECPEGHVLLPEEERKETLRVLRQSYADRIQELNSMPVRNDTLRMRKRKMEIEEELKKIDEGIKVFQRPKVFVKINA